jgi:hypothetical protein
VLWTVAAMILAAVGAMTAPVVAQAAPISGGRLVYPASACAHSTDPHRVTCDLLDAPGAPRQPALAGSAPVGSTPANL